MQIEIKSRCLFLSFAVVLSIGPSTLPVLSQTPPVGQNYESTRPLTLAQAEDYALQNHPRIASSAMRALAARKVVIEVRSAYFPALYGNITGTFADEGTIIAVGALQTSSLSTRAAAGVGLNQLVTDFGRTSHLVRSARLLAEGQRETAEETRAQVLLDVRLAYYQVLSAESVRNAVRAALVNRQVTLRQVTALAQSQMKSIVDVDFAQVLVSEAELAAYQADSSLEESKAQLAAAMGDEHSLGFTLVEEPLPVPLEPNVEEFIDRALRNRPDLQSLQFNGNAVRQYAEAEKKLSYPSVSLLGAAGEIPEHDSSVRQGDYGAVGININVPIFNGKLYSARHSEAELRAQAAVKDVEELKNTIARDVRVAWFEANNAFRRLDVTGRLVAQANEALRLSQARYENGLGSIVELNEAQLNQTSAEIAAAGAKYEYLGRRATLDYMIGTIR